MLELTQRSGGANFHAFKRNDPLTKAVEYALAGFQQDTPVVDGDGRPAYWHGITWSPR